MIPLQRLSLRCLKPVSVKKDDRDGETNAHFSCKSRSAQFHSVSLMPLDNLLSSKVPLNNRALVDAASQTQICQSLIGCQSHARSECGAASLLHWIFDSDSLLVPRGTTVHGVSSRSRSSTTAANREPLLRRTRVNFKSSRLCFPQYLNNGVKRCLLRCGTDTQQFGARAGQQ